jgi:hypothetical protein
LTYVVILAGSGLCASSAHAQTASPTAESDDLIQRGIEMRRANKPQEARDLFFRAYTQSPSPRAAAQLGLAEQTLGSWLDAEKHIAEALRAANDPWVSKNRAALEQSAAAVAQRLAWLEVHGNVPGAEVIVNGDRIGTLPLASPVRVVAGTVVLDVQAAGYARLVRNFEIGAGHHARESIVLVRVGQAPGAATSAPPDANAASGTRATAAPPVEPANDSSAPRAATWRRPVGWTAIGVGAVGIGLGTYFGIRTLNAGPELGRLCPTSSTCTEEGLRKNDDAHTWALISTIGIGAGIAAVGVGTWLLLTSPRATTSAGVHVVPTVGPRTSGVEVVGSW